MPLLILIVIIAGIGYGYLDAYSEKKVEDSSIRARVINGWSMNPDTSVLYPAEKNDEIFVVVTWVPQDDGRRVSSIHVKGTVKNGAEDFASFDAPCERAGSAWLAYDSWKFGDGENTDLECYVKLDRKLVPSDPDGIVKWSQADAQIANLRVQYTAQVNKVNKPMRYVNWIDEQALKLKTLVSAPFEREP